MYEEQIARIRDLPAQVEALVKDLSPEELTAHYMDGEWSVAQNVHHLADAHSKAYIRAKRIMTEDNPTLVGYNTDGWADLPDATHADIELSMAILRSLHARWVIFWENLNEDDWSTHGTTEKGKAITVADTLDLYSNHGLWHVDQITRTIAAKE